MTPDEFFRELINLYQSSRNSLFPEEGIHRGRSASISSGLEDLAAQFIYHNNPNKCTYYIDQPLRFNGNSTRYPDIVILNTNHEISHLIDMKADLGWNRNGMQKFCSEWSDRIEAITGTETGFSHGKTKEKQIAKFSKDLKYHIVVTTYVNSGKKIKEQYDSLKETENVNLYILSDKSHPNRYDLPPKDILDKMEIKKIEFDRLMESIVRK